MSLAAAAPSGATLLVDAAVAEEVGPRLACTLADLRAPRRPVDRDVDVVVVGAGVESAVAAVQRAHHHYPDAGVVVLTDPASDAQVRRALAYAPGVPLELVVGPADGTVAAEVERLRAGVAERRRHRAVLAAVTGQRRSPAAVRAGTVVALGALLDHAPLGVVVCAPDGTVLGWNRRAEALLRLGADGAETALETVLPGASAAVTAALPGGPAAAGPDDLVLTAAGGAELEVSAVPSQLDDGRLVALVSLVDVTERRRAERARQRLSGHVALLARVSESLAATLEPAQALERLAEELVPALSDWVAVQLADEAHRLHAVVMRHRDPALAPVVAATKARQLEASSERAPSRRAAREEAPVLLCDVDEATLEEIAPDPELRELARRLGVASVVAVPLVTQRRVHGSLAVVNAPGSRAFTDDDVALVQEVARRAAVALENARLYAEQRTVAQELQQSLLTPAPRPPWGDVETRYVAAAHQAQVGGDWYDAFTQPDGTTVLVIGDVIGHDVRAAAGMSQVRGVLRGIAYTTGAGPAEILRRVDQANHGLQMHTMATAVVATLRPSGEREDHLELTWANAGHPPPLVLHADGRVVVLGDPGASPDLLLGFDTAATRHDGTVELAPGATLLLYTDGLVERRGEPLDAGIQRLASALRDLAGLPLPQLCDETIAAMLPHDPEDDVAVVALRLQRPGIDPAGTPLPDAGRPLGGGG